MCTYPAYSVLMSLYAKEKPEYLAMCLDSMLSQSVMPEQIVIVLDGPVGNKLEAVVKRYAEKRSDLFTFVPLPENRGLAYALNEGLRHCRNELVARMDTDDISVPDRCEKELRHFMSNPQLSLLGSNIDEFSDDPHRVVSCRAVPTTEKEILRFGRRRNPFNHPTVMYRKSSVLAAGGYNIERRRAQDFELFVTMVHEGFHAENIDESLLKFRANGDGFTRKKNWGHCQNYINIVYEFWRKGYSSMLDLVVVAVGQTAMFLLPSEIMRIVSDRFLRNKIGVGSHAN